MWWRIDEGGGNRIDYIMIGCGDLESRGGGRAYLSTSLLLILEISWSIKLSTSFEIWLYRLKAALCSNINASNAIGSSFLSSELLRLIEVGASCFNHSCSEHLSVNKVLRHVHKRKFGLFHPYVLRKS